LARLTLRTIDVGRSQGRRKKAAGHYPAAYRAQKFIRTEMQVIPVA